MLISDKVKRTRDLPGSRRQMPSAPAGVMKRAAAGWETEGTQPRPATLIRLADTLQGSSDCLRIDSIEGPPHGREKKRYADGARDRFGDIAAWEMAFLPERQRAFFVDGAINREAKDACFEAVMKACLACKEESRGISGL